MRHHDPRLPGRTASGPRLAPPVGVARVAVGILAAALTVVATVPAGATERAGGATSGDAVAIGPVVHRPPVDGRVVRPFLRPAGPYAPGHRGVDLAADPGTPVRATARGLVAFAGPVVGVTWVSVDHPDGLRTSYGPLTGLRVRRGDIVGGGDVLGLVASGGHGDPLRDAGLHLGIRRGDEYLDPATVPHLVPLRPTLVGAGGWSGSDHAVAPYAEWQGGRLGGVVTYGSPRATAPGFPVAPSPNHLLLVAGLGTSSAGAILDARHLGYDLSSVTHLSHAGRRDVADLHAGAGPWRDQLPYGSQDTWGGLERAALLLRDQLRAQAVREPGRAVDLVGHSFGGVTIAYYLLHLHDPYDRTLPPIGHVVTIASPLEGSDVARLAVTLDAGSGTGPMLRAARAVMLAAGGPLAVVGHVDPGARTVADLATGSDALALLAAAWDDERAAGAAGAFAMGTRWLSIAGSTDVVVGAHRAAFDDGWAGDGTVPAAERRVLPGGHEGVLVTEALREVVWRFLADRDVVASPGHLTTGASAVLGQGLVVLGTVLAEATPPVPLIRPPGG